MTLSAVRNANTIAVTNSATGVATHYSLTGHISIQVGNGYAQLIVNDESVIQLADGSTSVHFGNAIFGAATVADLLPLIDEGISPPVSTGGGGSGVVTITSYTHSSPTATDSQSTILSANANRKVVTIVNRSDTDFVELFFGTGGSGLPLAPRQACEISSTALYRGAISAKTATGATANLAILEGV